MSTLTERELAVGLLAGEGLTDRQIADRLAIAEATVHTYWQRLREKIGATSRTDAAVMILRDRLMEKDRHARRVQEQLEMVISSSPNIAVFTVRLDGIIETWNPGCLNIFGYREDEFVGKPFGVLFTDEDQDRGQPEHEMKIARENGVFVENQWHRRKDGTRFWAVGNLVAMKEADGGLRGYGKICTEQTQMKQMDDRISDLERRMKDHKS